jgi:hypothetical protein
LVNLVDPHQFAVDLQQVVFADRVAHTQFGQGPLQADRVPVKVDQFAVQNGRHLIDPVSHQETPIKDRDFGLMLGQVIAV